MNQEIKKDAPVNFKDGTYIFVVMGVSVISAEIGSIRGSVDGGSVGAESNAWDSSPAPKVDYDSMLDNYEGTRLES